MIDLDAIGLDRFKASAADAAALLRALSNEHRLMILCRLGEQELQVAQLLDLLDLSQSALSQHLAVLREQGLIAARRDGVAVFYRIHDPTALKVIAVLADIYCPPETPESSTP